MIDSLSIVVSTDVMNELQELCKKEVAGEITKSLSTERQKRHPDKGASFNDGRRFP